jgi:hypothetical protein
VSVGDWIANGEIEPYRGVGVQHALHVSVVKHHNLDSGHALSWMRSGNPTGLSPSTCDPRTSTADQAIPSPKPSDRNRLQDRCLLRHVTVKRQCGLAEIARRSAWSSGQSPVAFNASASRL